MKPAPGANRGVGILVTLHLLIGLMIPYILLQPVLGAPAQFLAAAAPREGVVRLSVMLLFAGGVLPVAIAIGLWPELRDRSRTAAHWLLALSLLSGAAQIVENHLTLTMLGWSLDLSRGFVEPGPMLDLVGRGVRANWRWAHYTHLLVIVSWMTLFCGQLYRYSFIPRPLAACGVAGTLGQLGVITLPVLLGYTTPIPATFVGIPLAVAYLATGGWLAVRGIPRPAR